MDEPKKRGRPPRPKLYENIHGGKIFTSKGKCMPGEKIELSIDEYKSMKDHFREVTD